MHWCPRQTPSVGTVGPKRRTTSVEMPASAGVRGPGEMTMRSGAIASISPSVTASLRTTVTSAPSSQRNW